MALHPRMDPCEFITHVPVEERPSSDGVGVTLRAAGVIVWPGEIGRLPDNIYVKIDRALNAQAVARGSNMPVALHPSVWLKRCRRCQTPFIGLPETRLCSDACRAHAKRDSVRKASAKRSARRSEASRERTSTCRHCGERLPASRSSKRFCSIRCRVARHRGAPATFVAELPDTVETPEAAWIAWAATTTAALDRQIADMQSVLGAMKIVGTNDLAFMERLADRVIAMQAERATLAV
jgi:hypothetical protein